MQEALEASVNYRGVYVFKVDATGQRQGVSLEVSLMCEAWCKMLSLHVFAASMLPLGVTPALNCSRSAQRSVVCSCSAHPDQLPALHLPCLYPAHACAALVSPYMPSLPRTPELTSIYMTSGLDVPLESKDWGWLASEQDVAHLGGGWCGCVHLSKTGCSSSCSQLVV